MLIVIVVVINNNNSYNRTNSSNNKHTVVVLIEQLQCSHSSSNSNNKRSSSNSSRGNSTRELTFALLIMKYTSIKIAKCARKLRYCNRLSRGGAQIFVKPVDVSAAVSDAACYIDIALCSLLGQLQSRLVIKYINQNIDSLDQIILYLSIYVHTIEIYHKYIY